METRQWMRSLLGIPVMALALVAQTPPPPQASEPTVQEQGQLVHKPGDTVTTPEHFSRWEYPKTFTVPEGCQVHFVQKGDTLWDLGARYLGNPFAWPQIWEKNPWVKDAHWIYPGDPLLVPVKAVAVAKAGETPEAPPAEVEGVLPERGGFRRVSAQEYAFAFHDYIQLPYLAPEGWERHVKALGCMAVLDAQERERHGLGDGEKIFLAGGEDVGAKVGDRKVILKMVRRKLFHPDDHHRSRPMGDVVQQVGVARLIQVNPKGSVALIEQALDSVERGDMLAPFQAPASIPFAYRKDVKEPVALSTPVVKIAYTQDNKGNMGLGAMVILDKGTRAGLKVGDILLAVRERDWQVGSARSGKATQETAQIVVGQAMIVHAGEGSSTARILRSSYEVGVGTRLVR